MAASDEKEMTSFDNNKESKRAIFKDKLNNSETNEGVHRNFSAVYLLFFFLVATDNFMFWKRRITVRWAHLYPFEAMFPVGAVCRQMLLPVLCKLDRSQQLGPLLLGRADSIVLSDPLSFFRPVSRFVWNTVRRLCGQSLRNAVPRHNICSFQGRCLFSFQSLRKWQGCWACIWRASLGRGLRFHFPVVWQEGFWIKDNLCCARLTSSPSYPPVSWLSLPRSNWCVAWQNMFFWITNCGRILSKTLVVKCGGHGFHSWYRPSWASFNDRLGHPLS